MDWRSFALNAGSTIGTAITPATQNALDLKQNAGTFFVLENPIGFTVLISGVTYLVASVTLPQGMYSVFGGIGFSSSFNQTFVSITANDAVSSQLLPIVDAGIQTQAGAQLGGMSLLIGEPDNIGGLLAGNNWSGTFGNAVIYNSRPQAVHLKAKKVGLGLGRVRDGSAIIFKKID